jgi:hypothetical protein
MVAQVFHVLVYGFGVYSNVRDFTCKSVQSSANIVLRFFGLISMSARIPVSLFLMHRAYKLTGERLWVLLVISPLLYVYIL